jgi:hypothetical protein
MGPIAVERAWVKRCQPRGLDAATTTRRWFAVRAEKNLSSHLETDRNTVPDAFPSKAHGCIVCGSSPGDQDLCGGPQSCWLRDTRDGLEIDAAGTSIRMAIALGLFVATAMALNLNLSRLRDSFAWVEHTNELLRNISVSERALLEAKSGGAW